MNWSMKREGQEGAVAVEAAILFPILIVLLFGIIEFSVLFYDKAMLTNASREGARLGIVYDYPDRPSDADISAVVNNYCQGHMISFDAGSVVTTSVSRTGWDHGDALTVDVSYDYGFLVLPNFVAALAGGINLTAVTEMRLE